MSRYNHAFTFSFCIINESAEGIVVEEEARSAILTALKERLEDGTLLETLGAPFDTYEEETA